jgi:hypothetical protein
MARCIVALATTCADVSCLGSGRSGAGSQDAAARTRGRPELVVSTLTMGILSLRVKMQPVVRALTADTFSFERSTRSTWGRKAAGRTHDRPRRALAMAIAELKSAEPEQRVR